MKALVAEIDPTGKGFLDINQWLVAASKDIRMIDSEDDLKAAWRLFDRVRLSDGLYQGSFQ